tara:strand:- start:2373 stop:3161 length:789 start_codon:yes stop_codon:yes gene_type:complete
MKATNQTITGTCFHNVQITTTPEKLTQVAEKLGAEYFEANDGQDKCNFDFMFETSDGNVFTVYDWKFYRRLRDTEQITFNIGSKDEMISHTAKQELFIEISKLEIEKPAEKTETILVKEYGENKGFTQGSKIWNVIGVNYNKLDDMIVHDYFLLKADARKYCKENNLLIEKCVDTTKDETIFSVGKPETKHGLEIHPLSEKDVEYLTFELEQEISAYVTKQDLPEGLTVEELLETYNNDGCSITTQLRKFDKELKQLGVVSH